MSILGGLIDEHRETELNPSTRLETAGWVTRHFFTIMAIAAAAAVFGYWLGATLS